MKNKRLREPVNIEGENLKSEGIVEGVIHIVFGVLLFIALVVCASILLLCISNIITK